MNDAMTFFLSFLTVFAGLAWYLWHLDRKVDRLQRQHEATTAKKEP